MSRVLTFSRVFPTYHPNNNQPTYFVEAIYKSLYLMKVIPNELSDTFSIEKYANGFTKNHTIRPSLRWKAGDRFSPRVWSGKPYQSKQIIIAPDIEVKKVFDFEMIPALFIDECKFYVNGAAVTKNMIDELSKNDGLTTNDFLYWFCGSELATSKRKSFKGKIICWNNDVKY